MLLKLKTDLSAPRASAGRYIDDLVESARLQFITPGSGQAMVYQQKYEEALAFVDNPDIDQNEVPHIYSEIGITAPTPLEVAQVILNLQAIWRDVSAQLEHVRLNAKMAVEVAQNSADIDQIVENLRQSLLDFRPA